jgi:ABC-type phosphate transport system substrate-binding protein
MKLINARPMMRWAFKLALGCLLSVSMVAKAEISVIVNSAAHPDLTLTTSEASKIFLLKSKKFPSGGKVVPIDLAAGDTKDAFYQATTKKSSQQLKSYWSRLIFTGKGQPPKEEPNAAAVIAYVEANPDAVGYVPSEAVAGNSAVHVALKVQ